MSNEQRESFESCHRQTSAGDKKRNAKKVKEIQKGQTVSCPPDNNKHFEEKSNPLSSKGN